MRCTETSARSATNVPTTKNTHLLLSKIAYLNLHIQLKIVDITK